MLSRQEARDRALTEMRSRFALRADGDELIILDEQTIEREWGWVFFCASRLGQETGDSKFAIREAVPYIVNRARGSVHATGTAHPIEHYIQEYENQLERAEGKWTLVIHDVPRSRALKAVRSILRIKSFELEEWKARLPGVVRRGARADLVPLCEALRAAGVNADVQLRGTTSDDA